MPIDSVCRLSALHPQIAMKIMRNLSALLARRPDHGKRKVDLLSALLKQGIIPAAIGATPDLHPHPLGQSAGLPEHVDRDAAARIPVAADTQIFRLISSDIRLPIMTGNLMERAVVRKLAIKRFSDLDSQPGRSTSNPADRSGATTTIRACPPGNQKKCCAGRRPPRHGRLLESKIAETLYRELPQPRRVP